MKNNALNRALESIAIESKAIGDIVDYLDKDVFFDAVKVLSSCEKIITCASGSFGIAAKKFAHTLCCIERNGIFLTPSEAVYGGLGCVKESDAVVMVSRNGRTVELLPVISVVTKKRAKLISMTENIDSPLAKAADIVIPLKIERESDKFNVMPTASFVATIALFDALIAAIMEETDYCVEQFALIHPGGAVGEMLIK